MTCLVSARRGRSRGGRRRYAASSVPRTTATGATAASGDVVPAELTGAAKWTTVKIDDDTRPTTDSIFLGADEVSSVDASHCCLASSLCFE